MVALDATRRSNAADRLGGIGPRQLRNRRGGVRGRPRRGMGLDLGEADRIAGPRCLLFALFIVVERRVRDPLIDLALFRNRPFVLVTIGGTIANIVYTVTVLCTTIYLQDGRGLSPIAAGVVFLAPSVAVALSGPLAGRLAGWQPMPVLIPATMMFGGATLLATSAVDAWGAYVPLLGLTGFALGLGWTLPSIGSQTVVDPARAGEAAGVNLTVMVTIAGVAVAVAGTLIELGGAGTADITAATRGVVRLVSVLSFVGGAVLLAVALIGRGTRRASEVASPAS